MKRSVQTLPEKYQVCAVAFSDAGDQVRDRRCAFAVTSGLASLLANRTQMRSDNSGLAESLRFWVHARQKLSR